jgi:peptide/nickel transport system permease protein
LLGISLIVLILEEYLQARSGLRFDGSFFVRYIQFIRSTLHGDLGRSFATNRPIWSEITQRFPYTLMLATTSLVLSVGIGIPLGIYAATHQYTWKDNSSILVTLLCISIPDFLFAMLLVQLFSVKLGILPVAGIVRWQGWILPVASLALGSTAVIARQMRSNILDVIRQDYIVTARAKGQTESRVLYRHALKNALIPIIMTVGSILGTSLGGALIAEVIFSIPGLGSYTLTGLINRDYPVIQGSILFLSALFCVVILVVDIAFAFVDPRVRSGFIRQRKRAYVQNLRRYSYDAGKSKTL